MRRRSLITAGILAFAVLFIAAQADAKGRASKGKKTGVRTSPSRLRLKKRDRDRTLLEMELTEGRNRQIRKMCSAVGLPVRDLRRVKMGPIGLGRLKPGQWRDLTSDEVRRLKSAVGSLP